ncbi:glycoside hydrolase family 32 protein, partial [Pseudomonas aeruginosa]|nr:glycoside hydrolase family 32 protein [Pseudomonas aeruginosa]
LSPQGIEANGKDYLNLYETGYFIGDYDYETAKFIRGNFYELDKGHDFYATQTTLSPDGRRIVMAWMDMWESPMPEKVDGWAGALTLPRELELIGDHLYMKPVRELEQLRVGSGVETKVNLAGEIIIAQDASFKEALIDVLLTKSKNQEIKFSLKTKDEELINIFYSKDKNECT